MISIFARLINDHVPDAFVTLCKHKMKSDFNKSPHFNPRVSSFIKWIKEVTGEDLV